MADDVDRVLRIAKRYGVNVYLSSDPDFGGGIPIRQRRGLEVKELSNSAGPGVAGHYADSLTNSVWFDNLMPKRVHHLLHEVMHVVVCPPEIEIDEDVEEHEILMQLERVVARQCLSPVGYNLVVKWQEDTLVDLYDGDDHYEALNDIPNYPNHRYWRSGFKMLRRLGALKNGRATWQRPHP